MKRKISIFFLAVLAVFGVAYDFQPDRSIDYATFQPRFSAALGDAGFQAVEVASCSGDRVPLPLSIRWHPRYWRGDPPPLTVSGFPDSAEHYKLLIGGSQPVDCFVRYVGGRATVIAIHSSSREHAAARALHSALAREFPGFTIVLTTNEA